MIRKAILLVAGLGSRLRPLTDDKPKCMVAVNGKPMLLRSLDSLNQYGVTEAVLIIGYKGDVIKSQVGNKYKNINITYVESKDYNTTNNMYSLWIAKDHLEDNSLLMEGDVVFDSSIMQEALSTSSDKSWWITDKFTEEIDGSMSITDENNKIQEIKIIREKLPKYKDNFFKSIGMVTLQNGLAQKLKTWLDQEVSQQNVNIYYDLVLAKNVKDSNLHVHSIQGKRWFEIDSKEDLAKAEKMFGDENNGNGM